MPFAATFSAGLSALPPDGSTVERLVRIADERLYRAKRAGRNCVISTD
jgi:diguanylate cyclase (GGDEF)-like protein